MLINSHFTISNLKSGSNRLDLSHWYPSLHGEGFKLAESQAASGSRTNSRSADFKLVFDLHQPANCITQVLLSISLNSVSDSSGKFCPGKSLHSCNLIGMVFIHLSTQTWAMVRCHYWTPMWSVPITAPDSDRSQAEGKSSEHCQEGTDRLNLLLADHTASLQGSKE